MRHNHILLTGTSRSGGRLVSNIFSLNPKCTSFGEYIYFFRHILNGYRKLNKKDLFRFAGDFCLRSKFRNEIILDHEKLYKFLLRNKIRNYSDLYLVLLKFLNIHFNTKAKVNIEATASDWRNIEKFLELNKNFKAIQYTRDPRAILSSFKKITFMKNYSYFNIIFQWLDSFKYHLKLKKKFSNERYLFIQFEDLHLNPEHELKKIINFANLKYSRKDYRIDKWKKKLNSKLAYANISSYDMKPKYGFNTKRISQWKKHLEPWEIETVNFLCKNKLKYFGYEEKKNIDMNLVKKGLKKISVNKFLKDNYFKHIRKRNIKLFPLDPSKPENWGSNKTFNAKFIDDENYLKYKKEYNLIRKSYFLKYK